MTMIASKPGWLEVIEELDPCDEGIDWLRERIEAYHAETGDLDPPSEKMMWGECERPEWMVWLWVRYYFGRWASEIDGDVPPYDDSVQIYWEDGFKGLGVCFKIVDRFIGQFMRMSCNQDIRSLFTRMHSWVECIPAYPTDEKPWFDDDNRNSAGQAPCVHQSMLDMVKEIDVAQSESMENPDRKLPDGRYDARYLASFQLLNSLWQLIEEVIYYVREPWEISANVHQVFHMMYQLVWTDIQGISDHNNWIRKEMLRIVRKELPGGPYLEY